MDTELKRLTDGVMTDQRSSEAIDAAARDAIHGATVRQSASGERGITLPDALERRAAAFRVMAGVHSRAARSVDARDDAAEQPAD